jgi:anti-anti-sigma factor
MENTVEANVTLQEKPINTGQVNAGDTDSTGVPLTESGVSTTGLPAPADSKGAVSSTSPLPDDVKLQMEAERKISSNVMSICLTSDGLVIRDEDKTEPEEIATKLSGVYCEGVQYYDLNGVQYINNTGMAILIDLLKALLEMGVEVQFVNVHDSIKKKIKAMGLEKIINYGENSGA